MQRHYSIDDYYAVELGSPIKHEYYSGEIFAMAGVSVAHNHITANVLGALRTARRGTHCVRSRLQVVSSLPPMTLNERHFRILSRSPSRPLQPETPKG